MQPLNTHKFISFQKSWVIDSDLWFLLGQCKSLISAISRTPLLPRYRRDIYTVNLIKGVQATTAIEGNTLSEEEIAVIEKGGSLKKESKKYMEQEVKNVLDALNFLSEEILRGKEISLLRPDLIKNFHSLIGQNLGEYLEAIPGKFRTNDVSVNRYKAPPYQYVEKLMNDFCDWSRREFHYEKGQNFSTAIVQAIVSHIYIAWIHPFGDGNGRTARLVEFYLLLRAGVPDIASHILSNFYNETRNEYYKKLDETSKNGGDLTSFIKYALTGFKDGLKLVLEKINQNQLETSWRNYVNEIFDKDNNSTTKTIKVRKRQMSLILSLDLNSSYSEAALFRVNSAVEMEYRDQSKRTIQRDLSNLIQLGLLVHENDTYFANTNVLRGTMARSTNHTNNNDLLD